MHIGFIGVGQMGRWMAAHLLSAGYRVTVFDSKREAMDVLAAEGARRANSLAEIGRENELVITMLPNSAAVEDVLAGPDGLFETMASGGVIIDMSSSYVLSTRKLAQSAWPRD